MTDTDVHGPIDFVLMEFPGNGQGGDAVAALVDLVERGQIRLYDLLLARKEEDGSVTTVELEDFDGDGFAELRVLAGARSGLLSEQDQQLAADAMAPGTVAVMLVYENAWAIPFVAAARRAGGEMIATVRIPAQDIMDVLDELEAGG